MKLRLFATTALLAIAGIVIPAQAQNLPSTSPTTPTTPSNPAQLTSRQILEACAQRQAQNLPIPFTDLPRDHWAFTAVMNMYYCGPYRGAIPPEQLQQYRDQPQQSRNLIPNTESVQ